MIAAPPFWEGGLHTTSMLPTAVPVLADTLAGLLGAVTERDGVTDALASDSALVPTVLVALTVNA